jgi:hypothetical protein
MYLKIVGVKNIGPIDEVRIDFPFDQNGSPIPVVIVGENGSGKTIIQSHIVDALYEISNKLFDDVALKKGLAYQYYKVSGPTNVKFGEKLGFSLVSFEAGDKAIIDYYDKCGNVTKEDFSDLIPGFSLSPNNEKDNQKNVSNINETVKKSLQKEMNQGAYFYQPAYRYEEPFWRNERLLEHEKFKVNRSYSGQLGKKLEIISSAKEAKAFLLDLILDIAINQLNQVDRNKWNMINSVLQKVMQKNNVQFGIGPRGGLRVSVVEGDSNGNKGQQVLPSIDNLSLGQAVLLNLFINIISHADSSKKTLEEIEGVVVIDEVDAHLHTNLQQKELPELLKLLPKVQFIFTTHSPLFVLGMRNIFGEDGFQLRNMPNGEIITTERFSEFDKAYNAFKKTEKFECEIRKKIEAANKPILFVEGKTDVKYIKKAANFLNKAGILEKIDLVQVGGEKKLDSIYNLYSQINASKLSIKRFLLLYDCDVRKEELSESKIWKRKLSFIDDNPIKKGIENLFPRDTIEKAMDYKPAFIDRRSEYTTTIRDKRNVEPESLEVNKDEKSNFCDWLCKAGDKNDFQYFNEIFDLITELLLGNDS